ncbi:MAG: 30S ribosomal protein S4 [Patescibacteria group bacterium]
MAFILGPKEKKSRALGENLFLKPERSISQKSAMVRRPYRPGMHGKRRRNLSEYALQLIEKQKVKFSYGLSEKQLKKYAQKAIGSQKVSAPESLFRFLETRIDNVVFRAGIAPSRSVARLMVTHGHINLNGKRHDVPSAELKSGDEISVRENSLKTKLFEDTQKRLKETDLPAWLELDPEKLTVKIIGYPSLEQTKLSFNLALVLEFYSR